MLDKYLEPSHSLTEVLMLFGVGYFWARHTHANPVRTGLEMTSVGKVMREVTAGLLEFCVRAR